MKTHIMQVVESDSGHYINTIFRLDHFVRRSSAGYVMTDTLDVQFLPLNGVEYGFSARISARDYDGIIDEIAKATEQFFALVAEENIKDLKAGYSLSENK